VTGDVYWNSVRKIQNGETS